MSKVHLGKGKRVTEDDGTRGVEKGRSPASPPITQNSQTAQSTEIDGYSKQRWRELFLDFISHLSIDSKEAGVIRLSDTLYSAQYRFLDEICEGLEAGVRHFVCLKARQLGISTISLAMDLFWLMVHPGTQGALITDTEGNRDKFRIIISRYLESLPPQLRVGVTTNNRSNLVLKNGSVLDYLVAGVRKSSGGGLGRSRAYNFVHACAAPGTPVITADGKIKPIEEMVIGDEVITHTGKQAKIIDVCGQPNNKGDLIRITPWLGQGINYTGEHWIPTQRGMLEARNVLKSDLLIMPVRKITGEVKEIILPVTPIRNQGAGSVSAGSGATLRLTEELGFAVGYYLAEGHLTLQTGEGRAVRAAGMTFARHRNEKAYADRAIAAISEYISSRRTEDRVNSLTSVEHVYGASFASWILDNFGRTKTKIIPDSVFNWGEEFCRGLLCGLLCGDGSKTINIVNGKYGINRVILPTIHSSLAMQARDIAAALGFGWGACSYTEARVTKNRNEREQWRITWCGSAAAKLRALMGLTVLPSKRDRCEKYKIENGLIYIKIRKIEVGIKSDTIWDLSVDHDDHTFRTPYMSTSNTECSSWGDPEGVASLMAALAEKHPDRLYIFESTARGFNLFYDMWRSAKDDEESQRAFFIGWWAKEEYSVDEDSKIFAKYWDGLLDPEEKERVDKVEKQYRVRIGPAQMAWYRWKNATRVLGEGNMDSEFPFTEQEAFVATGKGFFPVKQVSANIQEVLERRIPFEGYYYNLSDEFIKTEVVRVYKAIEADLRIWEYPNENAHYVMGVDPAYGRDEDNDRSVIQVFRCFADKLIQVCEYATPIPETHHLAWVLCHLAGNYRQCIINLELTGPGYAVMQEMNSLKIQMQNGILDRNFIPQKGMKDFFTKARWYLYHKPDSMGAGYIYNWKTNSENKQVIMNQFRDLYITRQIELKSKPLLEEMQCVVQDGYEIKGSGANKDDRVMAVALAAKAWLEWVRGPLINARKTQASVLEEENNAKKPYAGFIKHIYDDHLKRQKRLRAEAMHSQVWEDDEPGGFEPDSGDYEDTYH